MLFTPREDATLPAMSYRLLHGARVLTSRAGFEPRSLLVRDGVVLDLLPPREAAGLSRRDDVRTVDLAGRWVVPGMVDAHFHLVALALRSTRCDLRGARSAESVVAALARHAAASDADVIMGVEWDESEWIDPTPVTRNGLDAVSRERPVFARRVCGHVGVVNSALLSRLTSSPHIDADSGRITERAVAEATAIAYPPDDRIAAGLATAVGRLHALGVTGIHDIIEPRHAGAYGRGLEAAAPLRVDGYLHAAPDELSSLAASMGAAGGRFRAVGVKIYADGSIGAHTAAMTVPYADAATEGGLLVSGEALVETTRRCSDLGIACAIHAIGDRAVSEVAAAMAAAGGGARFRIEHAEIMGSEQVARVRDAGVVLCMQPNFVRNWGGQGGLYRQRLGEERWRLHNRFRTLLAAGIPVVFGTDGMPEGPLFGLAGATRHPVETESLDAATAFSLYTEAPWRYGAHRGAGGRIARDAPADLAALSGNPFIADPDRLEVVGTWVGGERVFPPPDPLVST